MQWEERWKNCVKRRHTLSRPHLLYVIRNRTAPHNMRLLIINPVIGRQLPEKTRIN
jgi:hypothetical protein